MAVSPSFVILGLLYVLTERVFRKVRLLERVTEVTCEKIVWYFVRGSYVPG